MARRLNGFAQPTPAAAVVVELELELDPATWAALKEEAVREAVDVGQVLHHATLLYLADLSSGRVIGRLLEPLSDESG